MTRAGIDLLADLRVDVAQMLSRMESRRATVFPSGGDAIEDTADEAIRCQLVALHTLLTLRLKQAGGEPQPVSPARQAARDSFAAARRRPIFGQEFETGLEFSFPCVADAVRTLNISKAALQNVLAATTAEDWRMGPEHLAAAPGRHAKGYAFIYKDLLLEETDASH